MKNPQICLIFLCFIFLMTACNKAPIESPSKITLTENNPGYGLSTPIVNLRSPETRNSSALTVTPIHTELSKLNPSLVMTETKQISPTLTWTPRPTPTLTWTPWPTLPKDQAQNYAQKIMKTNGGCQLPCWIGISPGITTWSEAYAFLAPFADSIINYEVYFKFPDNSYRGVSETAAFFEVRGNGLIDKISTTTDISLSNLLTTYGLPSEIRIRAIGIYTVDPVGRFTLVLFYKNKGIMAVYDGKNEKNKIIHICPDHIQGPQSAWLLWDPADQLTFSVAGRETMLISDPPPPSEDDYIPLEKLTGMSINAFYQRYKDPQNSRVCIEIQAPDWP
jgi:hypothetical protein